MIFTDDPLLSKYSDTVFKLHHGVLEKFNKISPYG